MRFRGWTLGVMVAAGAGCSTGPDDLQATHPAGIMEAPVPLTARPFGIAVSRTGTVFATQLDAARMGRIDLPEPAIVDSVDVGNVPTNVTFSADGSSAFVTNQQSESVGVVDVASDRQTVVIPLRFNPFSIAYAKSVDRMVVTNSGSFVYLINPGTRTLADSVPASGITNGLVVTADGGRVFVSLPFDGAIAELNLTTRAFVRKLDVGGTPQGLALSADNSELYIANQAGVLQVVTLATGTVDTAATLKQGAFGIAVSPDDQQIYVGLVFDGEVRVFDRRSRSLVRSIAVGGAPRKIAFSSSGDLAVIANEAGFVTIVR
ncbi:MAG: YncE family protein [Gemmatimonadota bacterium]